MMILIFLLNIEMICVMFIKMFADKEKVFNFGITRIQISFGKFQLPTMSDSSLLSNEASLSSSDSIDSFSNFDKQNHTEEVSWRCSVKTVFLEISQNSQENVCARFSYLNKVARLRPANFSKKETLAQVFSCELCKISKNTFSVKHL